MMTKPRLSTDAGLADCRRFHKASSRWGFDLHPGNRRTLGQARPGLAETPARQLDPLHQRRAEPVPEVIEPQPALLDLRRRREQTQPGLEPLGAVTCLAQRIVRVPSHRLRRSEQPLDARQMQTRDQLARTRGFRPHIRGEIAQGEIDLMPDRRDHRNRANRHRPDQHLLVEGPQVFETAAAPPDG